MQIKLKDWIEVTPHVSKNGRYHHKSLRENLEKRPEILEDLKTYIQGAHNDARSFFEEPTSHSLDPLEEDDDNEVRTPPSASLSGYPALLPMTTLKGYFGEVFAGLIAENFSPFGDDRWKVPAYLFRFHDTAFQYLEILRQTGRAKREVFGRTGDDCLAFTLKNGEIETILYCEAKCTKDHNSEMLANAYTKFNKSAIVSIYQVIQILKHSTSTDAKQWYEALDQFVLQEKDDPLLREKRRYNFLIYVHGKLPERKSTWIPTEKPPKSYNASHPFEAIEIHLHDIEDLICTMYEKKKITTIPISV